MRLVLSAQSTPSGSGALRCVSDFPRRQTYSLFTGKPNFERILWPKDSSKGSDSVPLQSPSWYLRRTQIRPRSRTARCSACRRSLRCHQSISPFSSLFHLDFSPRHPSVSRLISSLMPYRHLGPSLRRRSCRSSRVTLIPDHSTSKGPLRIQGEARPCSPERSRRRGVEKVPRLPSDGGCVGADGDRGGRG
jgi:hypothetical protein